MPQEKMQTDWQVPPFHVDAGNRMGWVEEQLQEGEGWLEGQEAYKNIGQNLRIFDGVFSDKTKSTLVSNFVKYNIKKLTFTVADVREIAQYGSDAKQYRPYVEMTNKVAKSVYLEADYPTQLRKAIQYAAVLGRGYLWAKCKADDYGFGERKIIFEDLGLLDLIPVQVPKTNDVQDAYANTIYEYMPIAEAHGRFPLFQSQLMPVDRVRYESRLQARRLDYAERFRYGDQTRNWGNLYCEIRYTFVRDIRINNTQFALPMGDPGTSWFYTVPYIGQDIFGGIRNGQPYMRKAVAEDCRIYPRLRLIISSKGMATPMYDGPAFDWHGKMPAVQFDVDDWPWQGIGGSLVQEVGSIETTKRKLERKMDQVITTSLNPPLGYDRTATGGPKIENFDMFEENVRAGVDGQPTQVMQSLLPDSVRVNGEHFKFLEMLSKMEEGQLGINDLGNLANLKLNIGEEGADKMLEAIGPIAKSIAANVERGNAKVAYQLKFMIPQWYDVKRIVQIVGPDGILPEVFDYDPSSMIPSHMEDELMAGQIPTTPSQYDKVERARRYAENIRVTYVPSTLLRITQMQEQMKWMQLWRGKAPVSFSTVAKKLNIQDYGDVDGVTEREKYINEKMEDLKLQALAQKMAMELGLGGPSEGGQGPHAGGRPPSGKKPPQLKTKGKSSGNPRSTVTES